MPFLYMVASIELDYSETAGTLNSHVRRLLKSPRRLSAVLLDLQNRKNTTRILGAIRWYAMMLLNRLSETLVVPLHDKIKTTTMPLHNNPKPGVISTPGLTSALTKLLWKNTGKLPRLMPRTIDISWREYCGTCWTIAHMLSSRAKIFRV